MENKWKISKITFKRNAHTFCPLGDDWFTSQVTLVIEPDKVIPDYCHIDDFFTKEVDGKKMTAEDVIATVADFIMDAYKPTTLITRNHVTDSNHSEVEVERMDVKEND